MMTIFSSLLIPTSSPQVNKSQLSQNFASLFLKRKTSGPSPSIKFLRIIPESISSRHLCPQRKYSASPCFSLTICWKTGTPNASPGSLPSIRQQPCFLPSSFLSLNPIRFIPQLLAPHRSESRLPRSPPTLRTPADCGPRTFVNDPVSFPYPLNPHLRWP